MRAAAELEIRTVKTFAVADDPCLKCPLPDCDDKSPACGLRRLFRSFENKRKNGRLAEATEAERIASNQMFAMWKLERVIEAVEGGRAFKRSRQSWGGEASG